MAVLIVAGALANKPYNGGEAWVRLQWVLGFRRLGHEVYFIEEIARAACADRSGRPAPPTSSANRRYFDDVTRQFSIHETSALYSADDGTLLSGSAVRLRDAARAADAIINISGHSRLASPLDRVSRRVYVDIDPGFTQVWHAQGAALGLAAHNYHYTIGWHIGTPPCPIPTGGFEWRRVRPPIVLDLWPTETARERPTPVRFTSVASWRPTYGSLAWEGATYGLKLHEMRKLIDLPQRLPQHQFELALHIYPGDEQDRLRLLEQGWNLVRPEVAATPDGFRRYVADSDAEFSAAQGVYVHAKTGWFSDRSAAYLASGRPALVQDTGLAETGLPTGVGLIPFRTLEEAIAGADAIAADYPVHCAAARCIVEEYFESDVVLATLLNEIGINA
jgi:hypothetical protein